MSKTSNWTIGGGRKRVPESAVRDLESVLDSGVVDGVRVEIRPGDECEQVFGSESELPIFNPGPMSKWISADVCITPVDWLKLQLAAFRKGGGVPPGYDYEDIRSNLSFESGVSEQSQVWMRERLEKGEGEDIPLPVVQLDRDLNLTSQEGRNRGVAAYEMGYEWMNARIVMRGV